MIGFYQRFIPECHQLLAPFHELRAKNADSHALTRRLRFLASFAALKHALCTLTALRRPDLHKRFYVSVDAASTGGASAVLSQRLDENDPTSHVPLAFWSTRFSEAMRRWPIRDQECYALHGAMMEWRHYLLGAQCTVQTDHKSLQYLLTGKLRDGGRVTDWAMDLRGFDAQIEWIAGKTNVVPDTLSRACVAASVHLTLPSSVGGGENRGAPNGSIHATVNTARGERAPRRGTQIARTRSRASAIFVRKDASGGLEVLVERHAGEYVLPSVQLDSSAASCREQLSHSIARNYGHGTPLCTLLAGGLRLKCGRSCSTTTAVFVVAVKESLEVSPSGCDAGFVTLSPSVPLLLEHDDDWSALSVVEDELQGRRCGEPPYNTARSQWTFSKSENVLSQFADSEAQVSTVTAACTLPTVHTDPQGPAFCATLSDASIAVKALAERLQSRTSPVMAVDLEGSLGGGVRTRRHIALLQVCVDGEGDEEPLIYVFDTHMTPAILRARGEGSLCALLESRDIATIFHCCHGDAASLFDEYGITLGKPFDTSIADSLLNGAHYNSNRGLKRVLIDWLGDAVISLSHKGVLTHVVGMFEPRPLAEHLFVYAWEDVVYLTRLYTRSPLS